MTKKIRQLGALLILYLGLTPLLFAQESIGLEWIKGVYGDGAINPASLARDAQGNLLITGGFSGMADFDPGPGSYPLTSNSSSNLFVLKLNPSGNFIWARVISLIPDLATIGSITGQGIAVDATGNVLITGGFAGSADFDPGPGTQLMSTPDTDNAHIFIQKLSPQGNFLWAKSMGAVGASSQGRGIQVDEAGNVYSTGVFRGSVDFDPGSGTFLLESKGTGTEAPTTYIQKLNAQGDFVWAKSIWTSEGNAISLDGAGNIYTTGAFQGTIDFDPGSSTYNLTQEGGAANTYVHKLNPDGNFLWAKSIKGAESRGHGLVADASQNILVTGSFSGTADFDPGNGVNNLSSGPGFVQKLTANGNFVYARTLPVVGSGIDTDTDGIYIAGGNIVQKFDVNGNPEWQKSLNGANNTSAVQVDSDGKVYAIGSNPSPITGSGACSYTLPAGGFITKLGEDAFPEGFAISANTLDLTEQTTCILGIPNVIVGTDVQITAPAGESRALHYQWQTGTSATGPWTDLAGEIFKDLQPLSGNETRWYRRQVKAVSAFCELQLLNNSAVAVVEVNNLIAPVANADGPQWYVCDNNNAVTLNGSATSGDGNYAYVWFQGSNVYGTQVAATAGFTTPAITAATTYTLQVTDGQGCVDIEQVTIIPAIANAGADQSVCQGEQGIQIGVPPVADDNITYSWAVLSGTAGSLSCTTCAQPIATPATDTQYQLTVTVTQKDNTVCSSTGTVWVRPVNAPNDLLNFAGIDKTICHNETVVLGGASAGTGYTYTWSTGQYLNNATIYNPLFNAGTAHAPCPVSYTVTATKDGCTFTDEVKVSVIESDIDFADDTRCGPRWVRSREVVNYNCSNATYAWSVVSGSGSILSTRNNNQEAFLISTNGNTVFRRTVTLNGVSCSADIEILPCDDGQICEFELITLSDQACPKVFDEFAELKVGTKYINPNAYDFQWSPSAMVDNDTAKVVTITSNSQFTLSLTLTNKLDPSIQCTQTIIVNPPGWVLPDFQMLGGAGCAGTPIAIGGAPTAGFSYQWTGDHTDRLSDPSVSNPTANVLESTSYTVTVTEDASGCTNTYTVPVNVSTIFVDAGPDRTVCNGGTATLGVPAPSGTSWTYHWEPNDAAWTNNTSENDAQPQVIFAATSPQTFTVTATDPATGCTATDQVIVRNEQEDDEYSGADQETCTGAPVVLGTQPVTGATYAWFEADGSTPAVGLSCTDCAQPIFTNPQATKTFVVNVSYENCTTPISATVTVTVKPVTGLDLADINLCETNEIEIGFGNGINPAAPANATFQWYPETGLDNPYIANPTATVGQEMLYIVIATLENGCEFRDSVSIKPLADPGSNRAICLGESVVIGGAPVTGLTYAWTGADIIGPANVANPTVQPTATTTYTLTATNQAGCESVYTVTVEVSTPADFNITGNTTICEGGVATVGIDGPVPPNTRWLWSPATGVQNPESPNTVIAATMTRTYKLTQTNAITGCTNAKEVIIVVNPGFNVTSEDLSICPEETVPQSMVLNVTGGSGNYQYVWSPATGLSNPFIANPLVTPATSTTYTVTVTDLGSGCQFARTLEVEVKTENCSLPVTLVSFDVKEEGAAAQLTWKTSSEINSSYFEVQHSLNARDWRALGRVSSVGDEASLRSYGFTDTEPNDGLNYYRLKMVDLDGSYEYSHIRSTSFEQSVTTTVFPNPVTDILHISTSDWEHVSRVDILNTSGQTVYQSQKIPSQEVNLTALPAGIYLVKVIRKSGTLTIRKIVVVR